MDIALPRVMQPRLRSPLVNDEKIVTKSGLFLSLFVCSISLFLQNGVYFLCCMVTIVLIVYQSWRYCKPGIIVFAFLYQWTQVAAFVIWMNVNDSDVTFLSRNGGVAVAESCGGLLLMSTLLNWRIKKIPQISFEDIRKEARKWNAKKVLIYYAMCAAFFSSVGVALSNSSGFAQILVTFVSFKWIFFVIYGYMVFTGNGNKYIFVGIIVLEFFSGLYSYFSSFKEVLFYSIIIFLPFVKKVNLKQIIGTLVITFSLLVLLLTWTVIKGKYREFLNQGTRQQVVSVSKSDALGEIQDQLSNLKWQNYQEAINVFLYRTQYILHLAKTMDRVPAVYPHEYGNMWKSNIIFVVTPRILYPDKPIYQATVKTNKYTGYRYAGFKQGASFSLGYFADSYIDFGHIQMYLPLLLIAYFVSTLYLILFRMKNLNLIFRFAIITVVLYNFITFEADGTFLFGRLLTNFLTMWVFGKLVFPLIQRFAYK